ncbi:TPA: hypothetical protein U1C38_002322 [Streptococcus suis]|nr:hypothetical protein [Streptococcus suis]
MSYPAYQEQKAGIATSSYVQNVEGGAENSISGICSMLAVIANKSISRRSTARRQTANTIGNVH